MTKLLQLFVVLLMTGNAICKPIASAPHKLVVANTAPMSSWSGPYAAPTMDHSKVGASEVIANEHVPGTHAVTTPPEHREKWTQKQADERAKKAADEDRRACVVRNDPDYCPASTPTVEEAKAYIDKDNAAKAKHLVAREARVPPESQSTPMSIPVPNESLNAQDGHASRQDCTMRPGAIFCKFSSDLGRDAGKFEEAQRFMTTEEKTRFYQWLARPNAARHDFREACSNDDIVRERGYSHLCECITIEQKEYCPVFFVGPERAREWVEQQGKSNSTHLVPRDMPSSAKRLEEKIPELNAQVADARRYDCSVSKDSIFCRFSSPYGEKERSGREAQAFRSKESKLEYYRVIATGVLPHPAFFNACSRSEDDHPEEYEELCKCFTWRRKVYCPVFQPTRQFAMRYVKEEEDRLRNETNRFS